MRVFYVCTEGHLMMTSKEVLWTCVGGDACTGRLVPLTEAGAGMLSAAIREFATHVPPDVALGRGIAVHPNIEVDRRPIALVARVLEMECL